MKEKIKYLVLAIVSVFLLGTYADATLHGQRVIEPYKWILTSFFGLVFFAMFFRKHIK